jgi:hypothetical protein
MVEFLKELWAFHKARKGFLAVLATALVAVLIGLVVIIRLSARNKYDFP